MPLSLRGSTDEEPEPEISEQVCGAPGRTRASEASPQGDRAARVLPGMPRERSEAWRARQDSNLRPVG
jgi:hypothetical protein